VVPPADQTVSPNEDHWRENERFTPLSEDLRSGNIVLLNNKNINKLDQDMC